MGFFLRKVGPPTLEKISGSAPDNDQRRWTIRCYMCSYSQVWVYMIRTTGLVCAFYEL